MLTSNFKPCQKYYNFNVFHTNKHKQPACLKLLQKRIKMHFTAPNLQNISREHALYLLAGSAWRSAIGMTCWQFSRVQNFYQQKVATLFMVMIIIM